MTDIWGDMAPIEDKADAVMFTIGLMRRLAGSSYRGHCEWGFLMNAAEILERELEEKEKE